MTSSRPRHGSPSARSRERRHRRHRVLLVLLILSWAISWPLIKVGVATVPPIWYACFRYRIAATCLFAFVAARHEVAFPPRADWPLVAVSGVFQMAAYSALTAFALTILPPGRASVLAFSTPIWVVPLAAWWLRERVSRTALLGTGLGLLGVLAIAAPAFHADGADRSSPMPCCLGLRSAGRSRSLPFARIVLRLPRLPSLPGRCCVAAMPAPSCGARRRGSAAAGRTERSGFARFRRSGRNRVRLLGGGGSGPPFSREHLVDGAPRNAPPRHPDLGTRPGRERRSVADRGRAAHRRRNPAGDGRAQKVEKSCLPGHDPWELPGPVFGPRSTRN